MKSAVPTWFTFPRKARPRIGLAFHLRQTTSKGVRVYYAWGLVAADPGGVRALLVSLAPTLHTHTHTHTDATTQKTTVMKTRRTMAAASELCWVCARTVRAVVCVCVCKLD